MRRRLFHDDARLSSLVGAHVNGRDVRYLGGVATLAEVATESLPSLSHAELLRYSRHLLLPEVGVEGQQKLKAARVLLIGAGGLGSPAGLYLAAAGVGTLGLVDFDVVEFSNLQRQVIHGTGAVGRPKLESAAERIRDVNPGVTVVLHQTRLTSDNALEILSAYDVVVDGSDNFPTRYLVNDGCVLLKKPNVYGSIFRFEGQASVFWAERGPCYRCLYREPPPPGLVPSCAEGGVLGVLPGVIGSIQATEAIKIVLGAEETLVGRLLLFDAWRMRFRELVLERDPDCPICGRHPSIDRLIDYEAFCGLAPAASEGAEAAEDEVTPEVLRDELVAGRELFLLDVREPIEWEICHLDGARLISLGQVPSRVREIPADADVVAYCHTGRRSRQAMEFLKAAGYRKVRNLRGGVDRWAAAVDPTMARY